MELIQQVTQHTAFTTSDNNFVVMKTLVLFRNVTVGVLECLKECQFLRVT